MLIGILHCGHAPDPVQENHGDFDRMFQTLLDGHGFEFKTWNVVDGDFPQSPSDADGWLVSGSKHGAYENHPFIPPLENFIRASYDADVPMVGVCFGHQIIAQAMGGRVEKDHGGWAVGRQMYEFDDHGEIALNAWHQDQVIQKPDMAQVIARNDFCANAALLYGQKIYTIQPHPELSNPIIEDYITVKRGAPEYPAHILEGAETQVKKPTQDAKIAQDIAAFFRGAFPNTETGA